MSKRESKSRLGGGGHVTLCCPSLVAYRGRLCPVGVRWPISLCHPPLLSPHHPSPWIIEISGIARQRGRHGCGQDPSHLPPLAHSPPPPTLPAPTTQPARLARPLRLDVNVAFTLTQPFTLLSSLLTQLTHINFNHNVRRAHCQQGSRLQRPQLPLYVICTPPARRHPYHCSAGCPPRRQCWLPLCVLEEVKSNHLVVEHRRHLPWLRLGSPCPLIGTTVGPTANQVF